jgi:hypothetical protein
MKHLKKKLALNKETIANLKISEMQGVKGRGPKTFTLIPEECFRPTLWPTCPEPTETEFPNCN